MNLNTYLRRRYLLWVTRPRLDGPAARLRLLVSGFLAVGLVASGLLALYSPVASGNYGGGEGVQEPEREEEPEPRREEEPEPEPSPEPAPVRRVARQAAPQTVVIVQTVPSPVPLPVPAPTGIDITVIGGSYNRPAGIEIAPGTGRTTVIGGEADH